MFTRRPKCVPEKRTPPKWPKNSKKSVKIKQADPITILKFFHVPKIDVNPSPPIHTHHICKAQNQSPLRTTKSISQALWHLI